ncbi:MAG: OadG family transporter subunit [Muribaculaceae bacterium]
MNKKGIILFLLAVVCSISVNAQSHKGLRINEVMVQNDSNYVDEYGKCSAWIELYNTTRRTMNISSIYITTQRVGDGQLPDRDLMYLVPRGDERTKVAHLQSAVFFADGQPEKGTFHTGITLTPGKENYIAVYDADCITKLDEVVIPANLPAGHSFARNTKIEDFGKIVGNTFNAQEWSIRNGSTGSEITPGENNYVIGKNDKIEQFEKNDSHGFILTLMAMAIVFSALVVLSTCFFVFGSINKRMSDKKKNGKKQHQEVEAQANAETDAEGEVVAAIAMALYEHLNAHDEESNVLTFKRRHSDWNSKIATLTELSARR